MNLSTVIVPGFPVIAHVTFFYYFSGRCGETWVVVYPLGVGENVKLENKKSLGVARGGWARLMRRVRPWTVAIFSGFFKWSSGGYWLGSAAGPRAGCCRRLSVFVRKSRSIWQVLSQQQNILSARSQNSREKTQPAPPPLRPPSSQPQFQSINRILKSNIPHVHYIPS